MQLVIGIVGSVLCVCISSSLPNSGGEVYSLIVFERKANGRRGSYFLYQPSRMAGQQCDVILGGCVTCRYIA